MFKTCLWITVVALLITSASTFVIGRTYNATIQKSYQGIDEVETAGNGALRQISQGIPVADRDQVRQWMSGARDAYYELITLDRHWQRVFYLISAGTFGLSFAISVYLGLRKSQDAAGPELKPDSISNGRTELLG